ncbi:MAG: hydrogenase [Desulfurivibrio sp.]|nr:hydrogenase [Desulfurivibrio sp.]MBU4118655.1 4Fe-4S dicluster domain-containing protein [Pseudomonadota bacterium]
MIFKVFKKQELARLYELLAVNIIVGPVNRGNDRNSNPLYDFDVVYDFDELALDYTQTMHSPKRFVLPYQETLSSFVMTHDGWEKHVDLNVYKPLVFFGMHACDINALNKLDLVLAQSTYPNPYYMGKRKNLFIIGLDCDPEPQCFCRSMGTDSAVHGFDLFLTDLGNKYFVEILSATAFDLLSQISCKDPSAKDHALYKQITGKKSKGYTAAVETSDLTKILDLEFESKAWDYWGDKCLSCGTCANVCPTCYCYGVDEHIDLDLKHAGKTKSLHSCNLIDFAKVAGGHNFRPTSASRLKYRYYHKHRGFVEAFEEPLCVGCGRCGAACLADITPPAVIASVRGEE